jgi:hypothetical protein
MPRLSVEATIGLGFEIVLAILEHLHVREPIIIWGLFFVGLLLIGDSIVRGEWAQKIVDNRSRKKRRAFYLALTMVCFIAFGWFIFVRTQSKEHVIDPTDASTINDKEFLDTVNAWGVQAPPAGSTGGEGYEDINTTRLLPFRDKYDLMLAARVHDTHLSAFKDSNIQKSNLFPIPTPPPDTMRITVILPSPFLASRLSAGSNGEMEFHLCLIPHSLDASTIVNLDDITGRGGHVFRPARGGGMSLASAAPAIPLAPPSPNAHSEISETFVGVIKGEPQRNMTVEIHLVATTDVQVHAVARMKFVFGGRMIGRPEVLSIDFLSRNQTQGIRAAVNFSPMDWSNFISGSVPLTVQIPIEYRDRGMKMQYVITGELKSNSDQLANLKTERIKLPRVESSR